MSLPKSDVTFAVKKPFLSIKIKHEMMENTGQTIAFAPIILKKRGFACRDENKGKVVINTSPMKYHNHVKEEIVEKLKVTEMNMRERSTMKMMRQVSLRIKKTSP